MSGNPPVFRIVSELEGSYLALTAANRQALLIPTSESRLPVDRATGDLILSFHKNVNFAVNKGTFDSYAAVIECVNEGLNETFSVLAADVARAVRASGERPTPRDVSQALARWEELLRAKRILSREEELGLWAELWFLLQLPTIDKAVAIWRGPDAEFVDFVGGGIGIECKASRRRLSHYVSQEQVVRPLGDLDVFLLSIWVDIDAAAGTSVGDLVSEVGTRLVDRREFEEKLLLSGYSRSDSHRYNLRLRHLEPPLFFRIASIPRVRTADPGVTEIRFNVALDESQALPATSGIALMGRVCGD